MKFLIVASAILAITAAKPSGLALPLIRTAFIGAAPVGITQFHAQDELGQYNYGYNDGLSTKQEVKSFDGTTRGSYSYVDAEGKLQTVDYTADALNGFRAAGTNLPKAIPAPTPVLPEPIADTPEVIAARNAHLLALEEAKTRSSSENDNEERSAEVKEEDLPKQVEDTPEVAQAKAEHFAAKHEAELRNSIVVKSLPLVQIRHIAEPLTSLKTLHPIALSTGWNAAPLLRYY